MNRTLKYTLLSLLWGAVAVYIIWAAASARRARSERKVGRVDIEVVDLREWNLYGRHGC